MKIANVIAFILVIVGALNWMLIGAFSFDLVAVIFGTMSVMSRIVYGLVGIAGLYMIFYIFAFRPFAKQNA